MAKSKDIKKIIKELNPKAIFIKGFDKALYGTGKTIGGQTVAVYNCDECLEMLINEHDMDEIEAWEHFNNTVVSGVSNENKPIFVSDWRWVVNIDQILEDIKMDKQQALDNILDQFIENFEMEEEDFEEDLEDFEDLEDIT